MPTYSYKCEDGHDYTEVRAMSEEQRQTTCPESNCGKQLKRVYDPSSIQFKGSGWGGKGGPF